MQTTLSLVLLAFFLGQTGSAPAPIHIDYDESTKSTEIKTNWLYVLNRPDQFLQLKLVGRFKGKTMPTTGPGSIKIEVMSHAIKNKYVVAPELIAIADGVEIRIGKMAELSNFRFIWPFSEPAPAAVMTNRISPVPSTAAVLAQHKIEDLAGEWIATDISWDALTKLAKAEKIDWRLGDDTFSFINVQMMRLKQFVSSVTPASGVVVVDKHEEVEPQPRQIRPDTPSDASNASLKDTLDWLKRQITKYAAQGKSIMGDSLTLSLTKFSSCNVEWRLAPPSTNLVAPNLQRRFPPYTLYFSLDLKDLEPDAVEATESGESLRFFTLDRKRQIHWFSRDDSRDGTPLYSQPSEFASFQLKKNDLGGDLKAALSHAIRLCQAVK